MKRLEHNDKIVINKTYGSIGTVQGYAKEYNGDPKEAYLQCKGNGHDTVWCNKDCSVLSSDPGYYIRRNKERENAVELADGGYVRIENEIFTVKFMGTQYSDMIHFIPVEVPKYEQRINKIKGGAHV